MPYTIFNDKPYGAISPSDPNTKALGYDTEEEAIEHIKNMDIALLEYDIPNSTWNKTYWKTKPLPWILVKRN